jgi:hypothetical protein
MCLKNVLVMGVIGINPHCMHCGGAVSYLGLLVSDSRIAEADWTFLTNHFFLSELRE